jgi:excisionase family DNA binding protein
VEQTLTINPAAMKPHRFDKTADPQWAALAEYLRVAAESGEVVQVTSRAEALTPNQIATRLAMSRTTVMHLIGTGELTAYRVGTHWRIPIAEFDRFRAKLHGDMIHAVSDELEAELHAD